MFHSLQGLVMFLLVTDLSALYTIKYWGSLIMLCLKIIMPILKDILLIQVVKLHNFMIKIKIEIYVNYFLLLKYNFVIYNTICWHSFSGLYILITHFSSAKFLVRPSLLISWQLNFVTSDFLLDAFKIRSDFYNLGMSWCRSSWVNPNWNSLRFLSMAVYLLSQIWKNESGRGIRFIIIEGNLLHFNLT